MRITLKRLNKNFAKYLFRPFLECGFIPPEEKTETISFCVTSKLKKNFPFRSQIIEIDDHKSLRPGHT